MAEVGAVEAAAVRAGMAAPPAVPGVYAFRDATGTLLYVGSSRSLARRVASYFAPGHPPRGKAARIARLAVRVEWRTAPSVLEARVLEAHTIRRARPHFNRRLKQTGGHVYVRFDPRDPFPRLALSTRVEDGPWRVLGPFPGRRATRAAVERVADALGLRTCEGALRPDPDGRACLRLDLGQCSAPCVARIRAGDYGRLLARAVGALGGGQPEVARAAGARSRSSRTVGPPAVDAALAALRAARRMLRVVACVPAAGVPGHRLLGIAGGRLRAAVPVAGADALGPALDRLLAALAPAPPAVIAPHELDEVRIVTAWLASPAGRRCTVDLDRLGRQRLAAWIAARLVPGPLFTTGAR